MFSFIPFTDVNAFFRQKMSSTGKYQNYLTELGRAGVTVTGIGLGDITNEFMAKISIPYVKVLDYSNPTAGLASPEDLIGPYLYQTSTGLFTNFRLEILNII